MRFVTNIPTSVGAGEYTSLLFCDTISWEIQRDFGKTAEELGFDGLSVPDHLMTGNGATTECITTLAGLAGATNSVYLYPKTINNPLRHGPLFAKTMATFDNISNGRLKLGMGAGWHEQEAVAYGYDWQNAPTRLRELEETIEIIKQLWSGSEVTYNGDYYQLDGAICKPEPKQDPHPPIMIGGGGEEFTLRIAAKHADTWNYWGPPHVMQHKLDVLERHCNTYQTNFESIERSWNARCVIRETEEGVEEILDEVPRFRPPEDVSELEDGDYQNLVGTPNDIIDIIEQQAELGIEEVVVEFVDFPRTTGIEVFSSEVIPEFS